MNQWKIWTIFISIVLGMSLIPTACGPAKTTDEKAAEAVSSGDSGQEQAQEKTASELPPSELPSSEPAKEPVPDATPEATPEKPPPPPPAKPIVYYTLIVRGTLKGTTEEAKAVHNKIIADSKDIVQKLGDMSHRVYLQQNDPKQFLAVDVWRDLDGLKTFLGDPNVQKSFGQLFESLPDVKVWTTREGWKQYSENDPSEKEHLRVMVRGPLKGTEEEAKKTHNLIVGGALGATPSVRSLGDLSHHVFTNPKEPTAFLAFDVWNNPQGLDGFFKDPEVQKSFGQLFSAPPDVTVWEKAEGWNRY